MTAYVLVTYWDDWADEFDVSGYRIWKQEDWEAEKERLRNEVDWPTDYYFGTNEGIEYHGAEEFFNRLTEKPITKEERKVLVNLLGKERGHYPYHDEWE